MAPLVALVTGASGFVGGHVARRLALNKDMAVRALVRDRPRRRAVDLDLPGVQVVPGDLTDAASLRAAAEGVDAVVHCAADTRLRNPRVTHAVTVEGTRQMMMAARRGGARAFVHLSTIAVYGGSQQAHEGAALHPYGDRYGNAKIAAELALREAALSPSPTAGEAGEGSLPHIFILRPPAIYGPGSNLWTRTLAQLVARGLPACLDGGMTLFPYVYVDNLVDAVVAATQVGIRAATVRERPAGPESPVRAYNILDGITTWKTYLGHFAAAYGRPVRSLPSWPLHAIALGSEALGKLTGRRFLLNRAGLRFQTLRSLPGYTAERAERELGWRPRISLDEGMARSLEWLRLEGATRAVARTE